MAARIRLTRLGRVGKSFFRIIVTDKREKQTGKFIDTLGFYDPKKGQAQIKVDRDKLDKWIKTGAEVSKPVRKLLSL